MEKLTYLKITFHQNREAAWSPIKPLTQSIHTAQSSWRSNTTFFALSILQTLYRCRAQGSNYNRSHYVGQALLRKINKPYVQKIHESEPNWINYEMMKPLELFNVSQTCRNYYKLRDTSNTLGKGSSINYVNNSLCYRHKCEKHRNKEPPRGHRVASNCFFMFSKLFFRFCF